MNRDSKLAQVLVEFAHTLGTDYSIQNILDHLVRRITDVLPVTGAGVMLMTESDLHFVAASNEVVQRIEALQAELQEGPCLQAYRTGESVQIPDLAQDQRFPHFSPRALERGLAAVFTFPIGLAEHRLGALDLYRDTAGSLNEGDMKAAQVLADVTAAYLFNAQARAEASANNERLRQLGLHDPLTGLPNRVLLREMLEHAVARARRSHCMAAVLFADLDDFKSVNDRYGHQIGDELLVAVAERLEHVLRSGDTLARLSGDEFVILCEDLTETSQGVLVAERVAAALAEPFALDGHNLEMSASVGMAFSGPGEDIPESLLRDADLAMYEAKMAGGAQHQVVDITSRLAADHRRYLEQDLRRALADNDFQVAYQPIVNAPGGELLGVEALLRWHHPQRGWVKPEMILAAAERTGMMFSLGEWVLTQACKDFNGWRRDYGNLVPQVSVNVSGRQVMGPGFAETVEQVLHDTGTDPADLYLEITETVLIDDSSRAAAVLGALKDIGIGLVLDDFGTGYSSLSYLRRFPFDVVKIDQSFIADLGSETTGAIVSAIIDLGHLLHLSVLAEGIETPAQLTQATKLGVDSAQGYHISYPLLPDQLRRRVLDPSLNAPIHLPLHAAPAQV